MIVSLRPTWATRNIVCESDQNFRSVLLSLSKARDMLLGLESRARQ